MEHPEVPLEHTEEEMRHHAEHSQERWVMGVALTAAVLAVLAAVTALLAEHQANEAMIDEIESVDLWGQYQAKSIKGNVVATKIDVLEALGKPVPPSEREKINRYQKEQEDIAANARAKKAVSESRLRVHSVLSRGVTLFQIAIAVGAISVLTKRKRFWFVAIAFGAMGAAFLVWGLLDALRIPHSASGANEAMRALPSAEDVGLFVSRVLA